MKHTVKGCLKSNQTKFNILLEGFRSFYQTKQLN